jgi:hypothetical protein
MIISRLNLNNEAEFNFLMKTWKGMRFVEDGLKKECIFPMVERAVRLVHGRKGDFLCIRNPKKESQIFAIAVREGIVAHIVYVKRWFRRQGYAKELLRGCRFATFWTEAAKPLFKSLKLERIDL